MNRRLMKALDQSLYLYRNGGLTNICERGITRLYRRTIRNQLPKCGYRTANGVKIDQKRLLDPYFWPNGVKSPNQEGGIVSAHEEITKKGDVVAIIGGGDGISAVRAAKKVDTAGKVIIYEGGHRSFQNIKETVEINDVGNICSVNQAVVGKSIEIYGGDSSSAGKVSPEDIPNCDILELDCEGSELSILKNIDQRPRALIVEVHPYNFTEPPNEIFNIIENMGYKMEFYFGHDGEYLSENEFVEILRESNNYGKLPIPSKRYLPSIGARFPTVFAATRTD